MRMTMQADITPIRADPRRNILIVMMSCLSISIRDRFVHHQCLMRIPLNQNDELCLTVFENFPFCVFTKHSRFLLYYYALGNWICVLIERVISVNSNLISEKRRYTARLRWNKWELLSTVSFAVIFSIHNPLRWCWNDMAICLRLLNSFFSVDICWK